MGFPGLRLFFIKEKPKQKSPDSTQKLSKRQSNYFKTHFSKTKVCLFLGRKMSSSSQPLLNGSTKKHESSPKSQHCRCLMVTLNPLCCHGDTESVHQASTSSPRVEWRIQTAGGVVATPPCSFFCWSHSLMKAKQSKPSPPVRLKVKPAAALQHFPIKPLVNVCSFNASFLGKVFILPKRPTSVCENIWNTRLWGRLKPSSSSDSSSRRSLFSEAQTQVWFR